MALNARPAPRTITQSSCMSHCPAPHPARILPAQQAWPLFEVAASRRIEKREMAARAGGLLMRDAGVSVARLALAIAPHGQRVWVAAGPGGNGGDGLHAAADLAQAGRAVTVSLLAARDQLAPDARAGLLRAEQAGARVEGSLPVGSFDLVVDALLGIGAQRAPTGPLADAIALLNHIEAPCLAIDLPSGLNADNGAAYGDSVVRAQVTLSLLTLKPGLFTGMGRDQAGDIWFDSLGNDPMPEEMPTAWLSSHEDWRSARPDRKHAQHKGSFGDVLVIGGARGMHGAARLAAHSALAAGAGRVIGSLLDTQAFEGDATRPELLWRREAWLPGAAQLESSTVVCGCGGGAAVRDVLPAMLLRSARLVLDADALNVVAADTNLQALLLARATRGLGTILTPHPLEAARLLDCATPAVQADRLAAARTLAGRFGATVVLKGSGTVVAMTGATPYINSTGNASLAAGGTGDVLAGWIGGLWSQTAAGAAAAQTAIGCAVASVWLHGMAADRAGSTAMRAHDLIEAMRDTARWARHRP